MKKLKMLFDMIDKGFIINKEELEVFYNKADIVTDKYGEFTYTDMQFELADKIIYVNITDILSDEENFYEEIMEKLSENIPLEIQNPDFFEVDDFDEIISSEVRKNYIASLGSPLTYNLFIGDDGEIFTEQINGNCRNNYLVETMLIHSENNEYIDDGISVAYTDYYLVENELEDTKENFDKFLKEYVKSSDFNNYVEPIIQKFHENLEH